MRRQLPPLNALKAFEAAARRLSFTDAADELNVTQGAISRQIKTLEDYYQIQLFEREHRGLTLTDGGKKLLPVLSDVFDRVHAISEELTGTSEELTIKVFPSFAVRWLIPRLSQFQAQEPDINIRLTTAWHAVDFDRETFDAGIVHSHCMPTDVHTTAITNEWMTPVCSPLLLDKLSNPKDPNSLNEVMLLHCSSTAKSEAKGTSENEYREWAQWGQEAQAKLLNTNSGEAFDTTDSALQAAAMGYGVALGDLMMIEDDLASGRLVMPFPDLVSLIGRYYIASPKNKANKPALRKFRQWLLSVTENIVANNPILKELESPPIRLHTPEPESAL
ncbi:transcriptional regulator GcvA [uncultured Kiloniella sp.]|uniref:transcriptional regulator GcvA n=1 Tax=uncultured Kiloniella sp. TaxID=1133091 RepID=UPI002613EB43|nr:transcriptional regulator GcvA [uncultured Kiloniella sp.]